MTVFRFQKPLIESYLIPYREKSSNGLKCYQSIRNASRILAIEISDRLPYHDYYLDTITRNGIRTHVLGEDILLVVKIRSGIAMFDSFSDVLNTSKAVFLGVNRDNDNIVCSTVPKLSYNNTVIVLDPLIATGRTINLIVEYLVSQGINEKYIQIASLICSEKGIKEIETAHPFVTINAGIVTEALDSNAGVHPHIGDIGDRMFRN